MELKWLRGNPHDYGIKSGSTVYIIAKRFNEIHFLRTIYYYFDEAPARKTQEDRNVFNHTGFGPALDNFKISEVLCFLPLPEKEDFISDALKYFPELKSIIEPDKKDTLVTEPHDYRFNLDYEDNKKEEIIMENTTKLWKVVVEISHSRSDGNGESCRETKIRYFDDFESAEHFADCGDIEPNNFFAQTVSRHIYEYNISSVRELERKKHEVVREVKDITWVWE